MGYYCDLAYTGSAFVFVCHISYYIIILIIFIFAGPDSGGHICIKRSDWIVTLEDFV